MEIKLKNLFLALLFVGALTIHSNKLLSNEDEQVSIEADEIIVTSSYIDTNLSDLDDPCLLYTSPSPRDRQKSRMPSSA